nr:PREDICTED: pelargonidin 3-O-(6-caffeoylglucoside) 5-O-(6-O-malonylglucoside) 4'''-malonyltransferase-like [Nicotiana tabacum]
MMGPKIHIVSRKLIKPSNPTPKHLQSFKLSLFDQLAPSYHIKIILYYNNIGENKAANNSQLLTQLEEPLAHTLSKFYPLAGRLVKDQEHLFIDCSDQGVEYLEAKVDGTLAELLRQGLDVENLDQLLPQEVGPADSATSPLVTIQTTLFYCGGLAIGVCVSHKVADTSTVLSFINGWAKANQGENINKWISGCQVNPYGQVGDSNSDKENVLLHYFYLPSSEWNSAENTERYDKLQKSLAETLAKFYPLAGRFRKDDLSIHCNDEGVEYVETKVNAILPWLSFWTIFFRKQICHQVHYLEYK